MPSLTTTPPTRFIGCDVGKDAIVVFDSKSTCTDRVPNEPAALARFAASLDGQCLAICEATGGYEAALLDALVRAGCPVHRADARKVKAFIRSLGTLGKSDAIDARALARYGQERYDRLALWQLRDEARASLHTLVTTRRDLVKQRVACANRLSAPGAAPVATRLQHLLDAIDAQVEGIESDIAALIRANEPLMRSLKILRTIAGIGEATATALIALMPELGTLDRRQAAALAGLAPHPRQSVKADAYRRTRGGRSEIKPVLFMAAMSARQHNKLLKPFYERLIANGKKPLVALTALMRKIIVIANARLKNAAAAI
ncbi:MAG: IS110 family transposase [Beijerinckiaceae bacterium]